MLLSLSILPMPKSCHLSPMLMPPKTKGETWTPAEGESLRYRPRDVGGVGGAGKSFDMLWSPLGGGSRSCGVRATGVLLYLILRQVCGFRYVDPCTRFWLHCGRRDIQVNPSLQIILFGNPLASRCLGRATPRGWTCTKRTATDITRPTWKPTQKARRFGGRAGI